ncbi:hypothetical protein Fcan01_00333 [Folsomia candida]|uniref:Uncharacterized protein n=1 Tax=Folsomia candida TaxID=158441 RepID=A0A226F3E3_FOLCA|nr:hypothetical protein Fcan01_00333 [Folsomia candida]
MDSVFSLQNSAINLSDLDDQTQALCGILTYHFISHYDVAHRNLLKYFHASSAMDCFEILHQIRPDLSILGEPSRTKLLSRLNANSEEIFRILQVDPLQLQDPIYVEVECKRCTKYGKKKTPRFLRRLLKVWSFLWD